LADYPNAIKCNNHVNISLRGRKELADTIDKSGYVHCDNCGSLVMREHHIRQRRINRSKACPKCAPELAYWDRIGLNWDIYSD
jgi:hypothetical protein